MKTPRPLHLAALLLLAASCRSLEDPVPLTGTSSSATSLEGASIGTNAPAPAPSPPAAPVNGVTAPTIADPLPGTETSDTTPRLTVRNATANDGSTLNYTFQVARDDGFRDVVAAVDGFRQGADGVTSWNVTPDLQSGRHFWRARATGDQGPGPFSPISDFTIRTSTAPPPPSGGSATIVDPLTNGGSVGQVSGGRFTAAGWQVTHRGNFIRYVVSPISSGFVEWENVNLTRTNPARDLFSLMGMWDPTRGDYRENPFRVHIRKLDENGHNAPYVRMRFISNGDQHDVGWDFLDWIPNKAYRWRLEWGPHGAGNEARVLLDERVIMRTGYGPAYRPSTHWIELGIEERAETIVGVIFRNVRIGRR